ncbi:MAG: PepSY-associated TM helix domain-containing protein [Burkholderiaceae bacterium]|nr:PepSY-associated TM helix domain-containing protein [Burkholderiaceae bacterium]
MTLLLNPKHKGFLPPAWRHGAFLKWLKRTHAWLGLWGAALGLLFGISGFVLNHRAQMKINVVTPVESSVQVDLPDAAKADPDALAGWFADYTGITAHQRLRKQRAKTVVWNDRPVQKPEEWSVSLSRPDLEVSAVYTVGNRYVDVKRSEQNLWGILARLHKGEGVGMGWILLVDTLAGALVMLCLTGFLLWSHLHGPRLAALGLIAAVVSWGWYAMA